MRKDETPLYSIPAKYRRLENLHIVFWLIKDVSWCMSWKPLGIAMIFPTLAAAIFISWRTRQVVSELAHNLAIVFWITANSYWMIAEFWSFDEKVILGMEGKYFAVIPFTIGIIILAWYYIVMRPKEIREQHVVTM